MQYTLAGTLSFDLLDPVILIDHFKADERDIVEGTVKDGTELEVRWQENRYKPCIIKVGTEGVALYRPVYGSDGKNSRIYIDYPTRLIHLEIQDAKIGAKDQCGIPAEIICQVVEKELAIKESVPFFKLVATANPGTSWFKAFNFRYPAYGRGNGTLGQIWHLPRDLFIKKFITLDDLKNIYRNGLGQTKTFNELLPVILDVGGLHITFGEALEMVQETHPNLRSNFEKVFKEMRETRSEIKTLQEKCESLFSQI